MSEQMVDVVVPDIGDFDEVDVVEVLVTVGDTVAVDDSLVTLESDKASMEVPSTAAGTVREIVVAVGDQVGEGAVIVRLEAGVSEASAEPSGESSRQAQATDETAPADSVKDQEPVSEQPQPGDLPSARVDADHPEPPSVQAAGATPPPPQAAAPIPVGEGSSKSVHASPSIRRFARELGVDLSQVEGTGSKGRITKEDVQKFVKTTLAGGRRTSDAGSGAGIPQVPAVDFSKFGEVEEVPLSRIRRASAQNLHRSWLNVPHVTQFADADVTDLEDFRKSLKQAAEKRGVKLTPLAFMMKAVVAALKEYPRFNASLASSGESLLVKKYYHLGIAVDTPDGLVVPAIRDVDQKGVFELAEELGEVSERARAGKLKMTDIQGASFSISSLGGIGGSAFTPIVNAPEVAILGVARMEWKPIYQDGEFVPRRMLPLCLSYDHRVIDGAEGARFIVYLSQVLADLRHSLL